MTERAKNEKKIELLEKIVNRLLEDGEISYRNFGRWVDELIADEYFEKLD